MPMERLQKVLARAGIGARRACEDLILEGRVRVNGRVVRELGSRVDPEHDRIEVDGLAVELPQEHHYIALYKPLNVVSTVRDPQGRETVRDLVDIDARIYPVGRLDYDSEGLILMTDDGDLAYRLTHPSFEVEKEYRVLLDRPPTVEELRRWREGVELEDGTTAPAWVEILEVLPQGTWVRVVLHEGRNRQIRRIAEALGMVVKRLIRVREGPIVLGTLKPGQWRHLTKKEVASLEQHAPRVAPEPRRPREIREAIRDRSEPDDEREGRGAQAQRRSFDSQVRRGDQRPGRHEGRDQKNFRQRDARARGDEQPQQRRGRPERQEQTPSGLRGPLKPRREGQQRRDKPPSAGKRGLDRPRGKEQQRSEELPSAGKRGPDRPRGKEQQRSEDPPSAGKRGPDRPRGKEQQRSEDPPSAGKRRPASPRSEREQKAGEARRDGRAEERKPGGWVRRQRGFGPLWRRGAKRRDEDQQED